MEVANAIQKYITENNIPQKKICKKAHMGEVQLSRTLNGQRNLLADEYIRICDALCVDYDKFVNCT